MKDLSLISLGFDTSILAGSISESSSKMYERDFMAYLEYAENAEKMRDASTLARWRVHLVQSTKMSPNTINRMIAAVKSIMKAAAEQKYITNEESLAFQQIHGVKVDAMKDRVRISNRVRIEPETMRMLIDSIDQSTLVGLRNRALFMTLASSGLRIKELSRLRQEQVLPRGEHYILHMYAEEGKNQREDREAYISNEAVEAIDTWMQYRSNNSEYIFLSFDGKSKHLRSSPITPQGAWQVIKGITEAQGLYNIKPHDFRRFVITRLSKKKGLKTAQIAAGHKNIATTANYDLSEVEPGLTNDLF